MLLVSGRFAVSQTIIPEAQEHFFIPSAHRHTHLFGGLGLSEREVYLNWRAQAHSTLARARLIKQDLDDLNVLITKLELSANFAALYQDFQELPTSLLTLHAEIDKFREESEMINQTFGAGALAQ